MIQNTILFTYLQNSILYENEFFGELPANVLSFLVFMLTTNNVKTMIAASGTNYYNNETTRR